MEALTFPVPCPDPGEAGSAWRAQKSHEYKDAVAALGRSANPEVLAILDKIERQSVELDELWQQQENSIVETPWWADGNYDAASAQRSNDKGTVCFSSADFVSALSHFTDAISLDPSKAVFHVNRAAAALRLSRYKEAIRDALNGISRDPANVKAYLKAGAGYEGLHEFEEALAMYKRVLAIDLDHKLASRKIDNVNKALHHQNALKAEEAQTLESGDRPPLSPLSHSEEDAALSLLAAEDMLCLHPNLEQAKCSKVEGLILCRQWQQAAKIVEQLKNGYDKIYLEGELLVRSGNVEKAVELLYSYRKDARIPKKCSTLQAMADKINSTLKDAQEAFEQASYEQCVRLCDLTCKNLSTTAYSGLFSKAMALKAKALILQGSFQEGLMGLNRSMEVEPYVAESLWLRASIHEKLENFTQAFIDLQALQRIQPDWPGLMQQIVEIAKFVSKNRKEEARDAAGSQKSWQNDFEALDALSTLGLKSGATKKDVKKAYRKLAGVWHPDKWSRATCEQRKAAEEKFKIVQEAFSKASMIA